MLECIIKTSIYRGICCLTSFSLDVITVREHQSGIRCKECNKPVNIFISKGLTGFGFSLFDLISERNS